MNMIMHNLKVALRNMMKYKLQTVVSVLSIAVGIVTLAFAHAVMLRMVLPPVCEQPFFDRAYRVRFVMAGNAGGSVLDLPDETGRDLVRALKRNGGLKSSEMIAVCDDRFFGGQMDFVLSDSTHRRMYMPYTPVDPEYVRYMGLCSAVTGERIKDLKPGEGIISEDMAKALFGDADPVGCVQCATNGIMPVPVTIADVYESLPNSENVRLYFSLGAVEGDRCGTEAGISLISQVCMVLKDGCTESQLLEEVDERVAPFGLKAELVKESDAQNVKMIVMANVLVHLIGSLILVAAVIGFLRMQVQLFWARRREVSLRIVNGAKRSQLFGMFFTEVLISVLMSVAAAMLMGHWVEGFIYERFQELLYDVGIVIRGLAFYSLCVGALLLIVCSVAVWVAITRICSAGRGLNTSMRHSRTHIFRNVMLGVQITISIIFVCGTLTLLEWSDRVLACWHLPADEQKYRECVLMQVDEAGDPMRLMDEVRRLPDVADVVMKQSMYFSLNDITNDPRVMQAFDDKPYSRFYCATDTSLISFYGIKVKWINKNVNADECLVLNDGLYEKLVGLGLAADGALTVCVGNGEDLTLPVAGTLSGIPYDGDDASVIIHPSMAQYCKEYVVVPKEGRYASVMRGVKDVIHRLEPSVVRDMACNFRGSLVAVVAAESARTVGLILGVVSMVICAMSVYSAIMLDTRSRQKEVAIRKINGAKSRDIYRLFGRVYMLIVLVSLFFAMPVAAMFGGMMSEQLPSEVSEHGLSTAAACVGGALGVILLVALIVFCSIRAIMRRTPAEIIAKE